nr:PREDICTED: uncharacterized protein LOC103991438 isoform X4 [Musa acuminata subsp. malaccensis]
MTSVSSSSSSMLTPSSGRPQLPPLATPPPRTTPPPPSPSPSFLIMSSHCSIPFSSSTSSTRSSLLPPASTPVATSTTRETVEGDQHVGVCPPSVRRFFVGWRSLWSRTGSRGRAPTRWSPLVYLPCSLDRSLLHCAIYRGFSDPELDIHSLGDLQMDPNIMNAIFSAQRSMIPIDSCVMGVQHSAFLQQASYITGGVYLKPQQLDGLFQYLSAVFATDLQSRNFLQLPKPAGVDFRASCFCHKKTIDMGYVCSVCLSIFCKHHKKCSTCGSDFSQGPTDANADRKRKTSEVQP